MGLFKKLKYKLCLLTDKKKRKDRSFEMQKKKKALLIGINYIGTNGELHGCINDVFKIKKLLETQGYDEFMILTENTNDIKPLKQNILKGFEWLTKDSEQYNNIFLHYSGHGSWLKDLTSDESDGRDECLVPLDYKTAGMILDDDINEYLVKNIKTSFFGLIDACHSGSILDLSHSYVYDTKFIGGNLKDNKNYTSIVELIETDKVIKTDVPIIMISGCQDKQTSADAWLEGKSQGALTYTFYKTLMYNHFDIKIDSLMKQMHICLRLNNMEQKPVISSNKTLRLKNIIRF